MISPLVLVIHDGSIGIDAWRRLAIALSIWKRVGSMGSQVTEMDNVSRTMEELWRSEKKNTSRCQFLGSVSYQTFKPLEAETDNNCSLLFYWSSG